MNTFGALFRMTVIGESHGQMVGVVVDGCPAGVPLDLAAVQVQLDRRRPGRSLLSSSRDEKDRVRVLSGLHGGRTSGAPLTMVIDNGDIDSSSYEQFRHIPRPGHADYPASVRYGGHNDHRGGGQFSGRLTASLVMAGAVARQVLSCHGIEIAAHTLEVGGIRAPDLSFDQVVAGNCTSETGCADSPTAARIEEAILEAREAGDSLGGVVEGRARGVPPGLGDPLFHKVDAYLGQLLLSIPAVKAVAFGDGFSAARMLGSEHNDPYEVRDGLIVTSTNHAGGVLGGLTTGMPLVAQVVIKPTSSIAREQRSVDLRTMQPTTLRVGGRHDPCIVPRAVPVVEGAFAVVLLDLLLRRGADVHLEADHGRNHPGRPKDGRGDR